MDTDMLMLSVLACSASLLTCNFAYLVKGYHLAALAAY
jgi:hypothetical protein